MIRRIILITALLVALPMVVHAQTVAQGAPATTSDARAWPFKVVFGGAQIDPRDVSDRAGRLVGQVTFATAQPVTFSNTTIAVTNTGTFLVQAAQSGTWTVTGAGGTFPVTGTFWQATQPVSLASLPALAAGTNNIGDVDVLTLPSVTIGTFPDNEPINIAQMNGVTVSMGVGASGTGTQRVASLIHDGTDTALVSGGGSLQVTCDNCGGASPFEDNDAFTAGTSSVSNMGAVVDDTGTTAVTENSAGAPRMSTRRELYGQLRDAAGNERGANVNASNALLVAQTGAIPAGTNNIGDVDVLTLPSVTIGTFPDNEPINIAQMNGVTVSMGVGASGTGTQRVASIIHDGTDTALVSGGGSLQVTCDNCGGASPFEDNDAFTAGTSSVTNIGAVVDDTGTTAVTENSAGAPRMSTRRELYGQLRDAAGNERGANINASNALLVTQTGALPTGTNTIGVVSLNTPLGDSVANDTADSIKTTVYDASGNAIAFGADATHDATSLTTGPQLMGDCDDAATDAVSEDEAARIRVNCTTRELLTRVPNIESASTTFDGANDEVIIAVEGHQGAGCQVNAGTYSFAVTMTASSSGASGPWDGVGATNWENVARTGPFTLVDAETSFSFVLTSDVTHVRMHVSTYTSGSTTVSCRATTIPDPLSLLPATNFIGLTASSWVVNGAGTDGSAVTRRFVMLNAVPSTSDYGLVVRSVNANATNALNSTGTDIQAAQLVGQFDDTSPTTITENQFGNLRMSTNRNLFGTIRDAAGNERGANVNASNALLVAQTGELPAGTQNIGDVDIVTMPNEGQQTAANSISVTPDTDNDAIGATGAAVPGEAVLMAGTDGTNVTVPYIDPCQREARTQYRVDIVTATTTEIAAAVASEFYWICSIDLFTAGINNVIIVEDDSATNCPSPTAGVSSGGTTAAEGWNWIANQGIVIGAGSNWVKKTTTANRSICIITSGNVQLSGTITYVSAP